MIGPLLVVAALQTVPAEPPPAPELLERVLDYHDPDRAWFTRSQQLEIHATRPGAPPRTFAVTLYPDVSWFDLDFEEGEHHVAGRRRGTECLAWSLPGSGEISEGAIETFGKLDCDGMRWWRDYMSYLFGMPMNLKDASAKLSPEVIVTEFEGRAAWVLEVRYDNGPIWYFYADPATHALIGVSFHTTPEKTDGEIIRLVGEIEAGGIRLPRKRTWIHVKDGELAGEQVVAVFASDPVRD